MDFDTMSDKELIKAYYRAISPFTFSSMIAGCCAGELVDKRGYVIEEIDDVERFVKTEKKAA
jgi:hypothetical protein